MSDYKERVLSEKIDLQDKVAKLRKFVLEYDSVFQNLDSEDQALLRHQLSTMEEYLNILRERISRF